MSSHTFIFAGGGTGGHLYPGLAIGSELRAIAHAAGRDVRCLYICSNRPLDAEILKAAGAEHVASPASPMSLRPRGLVRFLKTWGRAIREARGVIRAERAAGAGVIVVAMGGFVAAPVVQAARVERVPILLVNLDAVPGKANRLIASRAARAPLGLGVYSAARVDAPYARNWTTVPPIVRREVRMRRDAVACRSSLGLDPARPVLMVTGGSQGARSLNAFVCAFAKSDAGRSALRAGRWQVLHQTGKDAAEAARSEYAAAGIDAVVEAFSDRMGDWWGAAGAGGLAIARSGAGNVAEVWASGTPTVFLPYPFHRDDHQKHNARVLVECGGAVLCTDHIEPEANLKAHGQTLASLIADPARLERMRRSLESLGPADGAERVARVLWEAANRRK